jgi:hypothetical protein
MNADVLKQEFVPKYLDLGERKFYRFLLIYALNKLILIHKGTYRGTNPAIEFLNYYERFIILYRREGDAVYLEIGSIFRKIAHKIYRVMLKKQMTTHNTRFLNLV